MKESAYKRIAETRIKLASIICEHINGKYSLKSKSKLIYILAKTGIGNVYNLIYEFTEKNPSSCDAIVALSLYDKKESIEYFQEKLKDKKTLHRDLMVECLGNYKKPELVNYLKTFLVAEEDRQVRFQAIYALYNIGGKEAALALCEYISDPDEWISMTILRLLCRMRELDTIPILIEKYHSDSDLRRKALMISFLSRFQSVTLLGAFDDALAARDARLRANAIEAIGELKLNENELLKRITPFLNDPNNRIRANAILALAKIAPEKVKAQIIEMCNSDDVQLRRSAAFILCMIPPNDFFAEAEKLIVDENETVRKRMIQSLKNFPHEFISSNINKVLSDSNKWIRKYAVDMVAGIPGFEFTPIVNILKSERSAPNIESCLKFLVSHPTENAMSTLKIHFKDKRLPVVKSLLKALVAIGGIDEVINVAPRLEQHDPFVVQNITATMLEAGDLETLDQFLSRFEKIKRQSHLDMLLPTLEAIVDLIVLGDKMPAKLLNAFSAEKPKIVPPPIPQPVAQPVPQPVAQPAPQPVPQPAPQAAPQPVPQPVPQAVPQPAPKPAPQPAPKPVAPPPLNLSSEPTVDDIPQLDLSLDLPQPDMQSSETDQSAAFNPLANAAKGFLGSDDNNEDTLSLGNLDDLDLDEDDNKETKKSESGDLVGFDLNFNLDSTDDKPAADVDDTQFALPSFNELSATEPTEVVIKKKPAIPHYKAGLKAFNLGKYQKALEEFNKSISSNESAPKAIDYYLGNILCEENKYEEAITHLTAFLKHTPDNVKATYLLGKCYKKTKKWNELASTYQLFIEGQLDSTPKMKKRIHQDMGIACAILGKSETAIRLLTGVSRLEPDNPELIYYLAMAMYKMNKRSESAVMIEKAVKLAPKGKPLEKQIMNLAQMIRSGVPLPD